MLRLEKSNIQDYLPRWLPAMDYSHPLIITQVGEGTQEEDGDGFLNYVFRVSDGYTKVVLKQSLQASKKGGHKGLPTDRGALEFESMKLRRAIVPQYVPEPLFYDEENHVLAMEDVSPLQIMRFQMSKNRIYPGFAEKFADYLAKTHFYLSEYYMDLETFRKLTIHFMNHKMRNVFDDQYFITKTNEKQAFGKIVDPLYRKDIMEYVADPVVIRERYYLREQYVRHGEAFLHADLHTSNILLNIHDMKVIDMEYTFCGPIAFDLGYFICNFVSQYICAGFREFPNEGERRRYRLYIIEETAAIFEEYCRIFFECWEKDAKLIYRNELHFLKESFKERLLQDTIGFSANSNMARGPESPDITYPEYTSLSSDEDRRHAMCISVFFDYHTFRRMRHYKTIREWLSDLEHIDDLYHQSMSHNSRFSGGF